MSINKTALCFLFLILFSNYIIAQNSPAGVDAQYNTTVAGAGGLQGVVRTFTPSYKGIVGTPYLFDFWNIGSVTLQDGTIYKNIKIKYNAYDDLLLYKNDKGDSLLMKNEMIQEFSLLENGENDFQRFIKLNYTDKEIKKTGFFKVLHDAKTSLFIKYKKTLIKASLQSGAYKTGNPYDEFVDEGFDYFIRIDGGKLEMVKAKEKNILEKLIGKEGQLKAYIKQEKLNFKKQNDFAKLIRYYNTL